MRIAPELLQQIVDHARREAPNECCGLFGIRGDEVVEVHPAENAAPQPTSQFDIVGRDHLRVTHIEDRGHVVGIYHSHPASDPVPSQTDINFAQRWPGSPWLIVGLRGAEPDVRLWSIGNDFDALPLDVDG